MRLWAPKNNFQGGASNRWDRIAQDMDRNVPDVIKKAKEYQKKIHSPSNNGAGLYSSSTVKTKKTVTVKPVGGISEAIPTGPVEESKEIEIDEWSQNQQKLLELGLKKYGKDVPDRWDKIADDVTGKDKVSNRTSPMNPRIQHLESSIPTNVSLMFLIHTA